MMPRRIAHPCSSQTATRLEQNGTFQRNPRAAVERIRVGHVERQTPLLEELEHLEGVGSLEIPGRGDRLGDVHGCRVDHELGC